MFIKEITLENFRNYSFQKIDLNENVNVFFGDNAQGKTNILEAIFFASLGKSFRTNKEKELIKENENKAKIQIKYFKENREKKVDVEIEEKKKFYINDIQLKKLSELIGNINVVLFTPEDIEILRNEPIRRRKFLNIMISQLRPKYIHILAEYNRTLEQRNNYLKQIKYENNNINNLEIWNEQLVNLGLKIYEYRKEFIEKINEKILEIHLKTTNNKEKIRIEYKSNINETNFEEKLIKNQKLDIERGYTSIGIHRDDFEIFINNKNASIYGSQGQQRSSIVSLKLAEAEVVYDEIEEYPIILLDDFMSELDKKRINGFISNLKNNQVIITCTEKLNLDNMVYNIFEVNNASIKKYSKNI